MLSSKEVEEKLKALKPALQVKYPISKLGYFGSYALGFQNENSDIDILVEFSQPLGWEYFDLKESLEKAFNNKVDLVSVKALKNQLRDTILSQVKYV